MKDRKITKFENLDNMAVNWDKFNNLYHSLDVVERGLFHSEVQVRLNAGVKSNEAQAAALKVVLFERRRIKKF
jgi:hypothetical protein